MPKVISLPKDAYANMVRVLKLPYRAIETTSVVGPFFWSAFDQDDDEPHLRKSCCSLPVAEPNKPVHGYLVLTASLCSSEIVHRKSDVRKKGKTRGWEMMLSHSFKTSITTGFIKGTPSSDVGQALLHLKACAAQVGHPMLLPAIILSYDISPSNDQKQRDARDWLRRLENAVSLRNEVEEHEQYFQDGLLEVDGLNRDLVECHSHVMWKRPQAYLALAKEMEKAMDKFRVRWLRYKPADDAMIDEEKAHRKEIDKLHRSMLARFDFYKVKLKGLEHYIYNTLERLKVQREAVCPCSSTGDFRLSHACNGDTVDSSC